MIGCEVNKEEYDDEGYEEDMSLSMNPAHMVSDMMERDKIFIEAEYQLGRISMATRDYTTEFINKYLEALDA